MIFDIEMEIIMQHVFIVGAKSLGAYGGYETFVDKLTEYHQDNDKIKYHIACKANGDGHMDESKLSNIKKIMMKNLFIIMHIVLKSRFRM